MRFSSVLILAALVATPALSHPKLVSSTPANGATIAAPAAVQLTFNEKLFEKMSGATLATKGMPGMADHPAKTVASSTAFSADGKILTVTPAAKLSAGSYTIDWFGVAGDTHRITGTVSFTVR